MSKPRRIPPIELIPTGVPGLDEVLGGGIPRWSLNLVAGGPGAGKTIISQQIAFANATVERPAIYFTVLGEPPIKMLRYQGQMHFFDPDKVNTAIHFINLNQELAEGGLRLALATIKRRVEEINPDMVFVDSFRSIARAAIEDGGSKSLQQFTEELAMYLTAWQATTFLLGEYAPQDTLLGPVFTIADGIMWLHQSVESNSVVRKLQVMKMRGQGQMPGLHTMRITSGGVEVFPRISASMKREPRPGPRSRLSTGLESLDEMMGGGIPEGDAVLVGGASGTGKTLLATQFIAAGLKQGEAGVIAVFEEHPEEYRARARELGFDLDMALQQGKLKIVYLRPMDLSVDETLREIETGVEEVGARRVVIDSVSGFELALAPGFRDEFRESLYRLVTALTGTGITIVLTVELPENYTELRFTPQLVSFLADDIILLRYLEAESQLRRVLSVPKMRSSRHSKYLRQYEIAEHGLVLGKPLEGYQNILGMPRAWQPGPGSLFRAGLTEQEALALQALDELGKGTVDAVARESKLQRAFVRRALERAVELKYTTKTVEQGQTLYAVP